MPYKAHYLTCIKIPVSVGSVFLLYHGTQYMRPGYHYSFPIHLINVYRYVVA